MSMASRWASLAAGSVVGAEAAGHEAADGARKLEAVFRRWDSRPVGQVIAVINPNLRGWVNYFRIGNAPRCFDFVRAAWVEKKVRRHMMREGPSGLRLEAVEYGLDLHGARGLQGLPGAVSGPGLKARPAR